MGDPRSRTQCAAVGTVLSAIKLPPQKISSLPALVTTILAYQEGAVSSLHQQLSDRRFLVFYKKKVLLK